MATSLLTMPQFSGFRPQISAAPAQGLGRGQPSQMSRKCNEALGARCDFISSPTNGLISKLLLEKVLKLCNCRQIMVTTRSLMLFCWEIWAGSISKHKATAGLKLEVRDSGLQSGGPAGSTLADALPCSTVGHVIGVGVVLGLKNLGAL